MAHNELTLEEAWSGLADDPDAVLIDVRTDAEWNFVGLPDVTSIGNDFRTIQWIRFPDGSPNPDFLAQVADGLRPDQHVLFLCRSGARSRAAAQALIGAGFTRVSNITAGFEGDLDADGHRHGGWKDHLPWRQS